MHEQPRRSLDDRLLEDLGRLVGSRNRLAARMLAYLIEVDDRQLQLRRAFGSMCPWVVAQLRERHAADLSRHTLVELVREALLLLAPGSSAPR